MYKRQLQSSKKFTIPFNRQQLADYLSVDRSSMTVELYKMKDEGLIDFDKNNFTVCCDSLLRHRYKKTAIK